MVRGTYLRAGRGEREWYDKRGAEEGGARGCGRRGKRRPQTHTPTVRRITTIPPRRSSALHHHCHVNRHHYHHTMPIVTISINPALTS